MNKTEAMKRLEAAGSEQTRRIYRNHGVQGEQFGVKYADLEKLRKEIGTDQRLAAALWRTGNHDAQVLATKIADPQAFDGKTLEAWSKEFADHVITSAFADLVRQTPHAERLMKRWTRARGEWISTVGWFVLARLADEAAYDDAFFEPFLETIEERIHAAPNRTRYGMNTALIAIGCRPGLSEAALGVAAEIGAVEVDHGDTGCKTPDAASYIQKTLAHRRKRSAKKKTGPRKATRSSRR